MWPVHARAPPFFVVFRAKEANIAKTPRTRGFCALTGRYGTQTPRRPLEAARNRLFVDLDLLINAGAGRSDTSFSSFGALGGHPFRDFVFPSVPAGKSKKRAPFRIGWGDLNAGMSSK